MKDQEKKTLPWWVEILFVQIGLPDKWLRSILKTKKDTIYFLKENNSTINLSLVTIATILYINPLIKQARNYNNCIENSTDIILRTDIAKKYNSKKSRKAIANNFCSGGSIQI